MKKSALSWAAAYTQGALTAYAAPLLAQDAKIDISPVVDGLTRKNFAQRKPVIGLQFKGLLHGKLAKDSDLGDVEEMLDRVEEAVEDLADTVEEVPEAPVADPEPDAEDASGGEVVAFLEGKLSPEDLEQVKAMLSGSSSMPAADKNPPPAQDGAPQPRAPDMSKTITPQAMDAALKRERLAQDARIERVRQEEREFHRSLRAAERFVRPWVGDLPAMDSEEQIHRAACDVLGIKHTGVHASALPVLIERTPKPGEQAPRPARRTVTQDSAAAAEVAQAFPHMHRLSA